MWKTEIPYDAKSSLLAINPKKIKTLIQKDICVPMFMEALFIMVKIWKYHKCLSIDKWIRKMWYRYTMEYFAAIKMMGSCHLRQRVYPEGYYAK